MAGAGSAGRVAVIVTAAGLAAALVGCASASIDERPVVHIAEAAQPLVAVPVGGFLPSAPELSAALDTGPHGLMGQLVEGGPEILLRSVEGAAVTPAQCVSTAYRLQEVVYAAAPVRSVASGSWAGGGFDGPPVSGFFGVVQMASAPEAQKFFATLTDQWRRCNGRAVVLRQPGHGEESIRIADVAFKDRVISATVLHAASGSGAAGVSRAMGLAGDCIVDVEITDPRGRGGARPAADVAELMLDKISPGR